MGLEAGQSLLGTEHSSPVGEILIISIDVGWLQVCILFLKIGINFVSINAYSYIDQESIASITIY